MNNQKLLFFLLVLISSGSFMACRKDGKTLPLQVLQTNLSSDFDDVCFIDSLRGVVVGGKRFNYGVSAYTNNGGQSWAIDSVESSNLTRVQIINSRAVASHSGTGFAISSDTGRTFQKVFEFYREVMQGVAFWDENHGISVGGSNYQGGIIYHYNNPYGNIDYIIDSTDHEYMDAQFTDVNTVHVVGYGIVQSSHDGGYHWQIADIAGDMFRSVHFPTPQVGYAVGYYGTIIKTTDGGATWRKCRDGNALFIKRYAFRSVFFTDENNGYIVGENSVFWQTSNGGEDWTPITNLPAGLRLTGINVHEGVGYISASNGQVIKFWED